jgi:GTP-binding protein EngB required for normal cell division
MTDAPPKNSLAGRFEALRTREHELITRLLDVLPRIDGLEAELIGQTRDALFHADTPFLVVLMGPFSAGKSSLINALLDQPDLLKTGVTPTTDAITILRYGDEVQRIDAGDTINLLAPVPLLKTVSLVDTPGLESVFKTHDEVTRKFLHRSDAVLLVMLATQAMTARMADYLGKLKAYGKTVIIVLNQADLLNEDDIPGLLNYVREQSQSALGYTPEIWLTSARQAQEANEGDERDEELWQRSGVAQFARYADRQMTDADRLRQKLNTPLKIVQHVLQEARGAVAGHQTSLDQYQQIAENIERQLAVMKADEDKLVREISAAAAARFAETGQRGRAAIAEATAFRRTPGAFGRGLVELVGLTGLMRREPTVVANALKAHKVFEPLDHLPETVEPLGPRLEGKDLQDVEALVTYARKEVEALPPGIRGHLIGELRAPAKYERGALLTVAAELEPIEQAARTEPASRAEKALSAARVYLAGWELICLVFLAAFLFARPQAPDMPALWVGLALVALVAALLGLVAYVLRGRQMGGAFASTQDKAGNQYSAVLAKAGEQQVAYGMELRRAAAEPLLRLVTAQTTALEEQGRALKQVSDATVTLASDIAALK